MGLHGRPLQAPSPSTCSQSWLCSTVRTQLLSTPGSLAGNSRSSLCPEDPSPDFCTSFSSNVMSERPSLSAHPPQVKYPFLLLCTAPLHSFSLPLPCFMALGITWSSYSHDLLDLFSVHSHVSFTRTELCSTVPGLQDRLEWMNECLRTWNEWT